MWLLRSLTLKSVCLKGVGLQKVVVGVLVCLTASTTLRLMRRSLEAIVGSLLCADNLYVFLFSSPFNFVILILLFCKVYVLKGNWWKGRSLLYCDQRLM